MLLCNDLHREKHIQINLNWIFMKSFSSSNTIGNNRKCHKGAQKNKNKKHSTKDFYCWYSGKYILVWNMSKQLNQSAMPGRASELCVSNAVSPSLKFWWLKLSFFYEKKSSRFNPSSVTFYRPLKSLLQAWMAIKKNIKGIVHPIIEILRSYKM